MFDLVYNNKRIIQVILALITLPFAFFGVDSYFRDSGGSDAVASFEGRKITEQEFTMALRERQDFLRNVSGGKVSAEQLDNPQLRASVLEGMIRQQLLLDRAQRSGMTVSERQLRSAINEIPAFQENGKFSYQQYEQLLQAQNMTPVMFEARVRQQIVMQQIDDAYADTSFVPRTVAERLARITAEQRDLSQATVPASRFAAQVKLEDGAARKYYDGHQDEFRVPEQARVEYVALSTEQLMSQATVDPADIKRYYEEHRKQFEVPESREASHILIAVDPSAGSEAKKKAQARAQEIYEEVMRHPDQFAELAKKYSQDPGSAAKGGDLGYFTRGSMVKGFDDAVFNMKVGEISKPVESEYGYHIIKLTGIRPGHVPGPEQVSGQIEQEVRKQKAQRAYNELAEKFSNIVFEQSDSLKPAADLLHVTPKQTGWIKRKHADEKVLDNERMLQAIFSEDVLHNKRNSEAIEVAPGTLVAARVIEQKPASIKPFDQVSADIAKTLTHQRAAQLAAQQGRQAVERLKQGKAVQLDWSAGELVSRRDTKGLPEPVLKRLFKMGVDKLPSYDGVEATNGDYIVLKVSRVVEPEKVDTAQQNGIAANVQQAVGQEELGAYVAYLRRKADVKIKQDLLEKKNP
jgi:peptidyl-prolyl cis-trans isomerase D